MDNVFSFWVLVIFLIHQTQMVAPTILVCQSTKLDETIKYGPVSYKKYHCNATFKKCCPEGCCLIFPDVPWYIWIILAMAVIVVFLILCIILFYIRMFRKVMIIRRRRNTVTNNYTVATSRSRKSEAPPDYSVAINLPHPRKDLHQVPTYDEAIAQQSR